MQEYSRKYGVETIVNFVLFEVDGVDFRVDAVDAGADCTIRKDQGADATCANDFVDEGIGYSLTLTATEMQAAEITVYVVDSATKVWLDDVLKIETYGNASAEHAFDLGTASSAQTGDSYAVVAHATYGNDKLVRSTTPANALDVSATGEAGLDFDNIKDATGAHTLTNITVPVVTTNTDMVGTNGSALAASYTATRAGYLDELAAANLPTDIADIPTVAEFNARSIVSADYTIVSDLGTVQTGDGYAVVNSGTFGNAQLVRSTTPANTLDVSATGEAGLDFDNIKDAALAHTLTNITVPTVTTVGTTTTNSDMRGTESAALATGLATHDGKLDTAQLDLDTITGTDGTTLATAQGNYAPNVVVPDAAGTAAVPGDAMTLAADAIKAVSFDESTAFPLKADDSAATQIARVGADGDTLETLSDQIDGVDTKQDTAQTDLDTLTDARGEPAQGTPPVSATTNEKVDQMYKRFRNKSDSDGTTEQYYNDDTTTVDSKRTVSEAGGTVTKAETVTGP